MTRRRGARHGRAGERPAARRPVAARLSLSALALVVCALWVVSGVGGVHGHGADGDAPSEVAGVPTGPEAGARPDATGPTDGHGDPGTDAGRDPGTGADGPAESTEQGEDDGAPGPPAPRPDPTGDAYRAVRAGDCLTSAGPGTADGGVAELPHRVACDEAAAFHRVTGTASAPDGCAAGVGLSTWYHTAGDGRTTALCLERVFRAGQCFAASRVPAGDAGRPEGATDAPEMADADLRTPLACDASSVPAPYNEVLRVTEVRTVTQGEVGRAKPSCAHGAGDRWYWIANGGRTLVCATLAG